MRRSRALGALLPLVVLLGACGPGPHLLYGFMDAQGEWVVPPEYDEAYPFSGGLAAVKKGDRWGFVDTQGRRVIEPAFAKAWVFSEGLAPVKADSGWRFIDTAGETMIPGPFEFALPFADGLAAIQTDGKWGFINGEGEPVIPAQFEELQCAVVDLLPLFARSCFSENLAAARVGKLWGYIDREGRWAIEPQFENAMPFSEGLATACEPRADGKCLYGYIDRRGQWAIAPRFLGAMHFSGGRAIAMIERNGQPPTPDAVAVGEPAATARTAILIDGAGREIADLDWEPLLEIFAEAARVIDAVAPDYLAEGLVPATRGARWGYRDRDGQWRIEPQYLIALPFRNGIAAVGLSDNPASQPLDPDRWELVDTQARRIGMPGLTMLGGGGGPLFAAQLHSRWGLLDRDGRWRAPPVYAEATEDWLDLPMFRWGAGDGLYRMGVHANHRWIVADMRGRRLAAGEFQWVSELRNPEAEPGLRLSFLQNGLWGLADSRLRPVVGPRFDNILVAANGLLAVTFESRVGCMDRDGRWVVPAEFDEIEVCGSGRVRGRRGTEAGTWTREGGWTPDAPGDDPAAAESVYSDFVLISDAAFWRKEGEVYRLYTGSARALFDGSARAAGMEPADEVRGVKMQVAGKAALEQLAIVRRGASWFVLDETGRARLPAGYQSVGKLFDGLIAVQRDGRWSIVDAKGRDAFPAQDDELQPFTHNVAIFRRDERCGLLHRDGRVLLPPTYSAILPLSRSHARIHVPDPGKGYERVGIIDASGRVLVEPVYRNIEEFSTVAWVATHPEGMHLLSTTTGRPLPGLERLISVADQFSDGLAAANFRIGQDAERSGYLDEAGRIVIAPRFDPHPNAAPYPGAGFDDAWAFRAGAALVTIDGRCGAIDRRGRLIVPAEYDHCDRLSDGRFLFGAEAGAPPLEPFLKTAPAGMRR